MNKFENLVELKHPICLENLAILRDKKTKAEHFRNALKKIAYFLIYEASKDLPLENITVETPLMKTSVKRPDRKIKLIAVPILRAGLGFSEVISELLPEISIQHIGMYRDEKTLKPVWYYDKTPIEYKHPEKLRIFILDPMLATGNSSLEAIKLFANKHIPPENITLITLLSSPEGIKKINHAFGDVKIYTACVDEKLNEKGYILPGLGDAGDRIFNTL